MGFWKNILGATSQHYIDVHNFGRYCDSSTDLMRIELWDKSITEFNSQNYQESILLCIKYLINPSQTNIILTTTDGQTNFNILHGSKKTIGYFNATQFKAEVQIAQPAEIKIGFLREAIEANYLLHYCRFALTESNTLCLKFDSYIEDANPYKIFYALKELSQYADKKDDILINKFPSLLPIHTEHIIKESEASLKLKYRFYKKIIAIPHSENYVNFDKNTHIGVASYYLLSRLYKIDFLLKPEGRIMEIIEESHKNYFEKNDIDIETKIQNLQLSYDRLSSIAEQEFNSEIYDIISTFSWLSPAPANTLNEIISKEFKTFDYYYTQQNYKICEAICSYIVGYCLYNYSHPNPIKRLFILCYELMEPEYFGDLYQDKNYEILSPISPKDLKSKVQSILADYDPQQSLGDVAIPKFSTEQVLQLKEIIFLIQNLAI